MRTRNMRRRGWLRWERANSAASSNAPRSTAPRAPQPETDRPASYRRGELAAAAPRTDSMRRADRVDGCLERFLAPARSQMPDTAVPCLVPRRTGSRDRDCVQHRPHRFRKCRVHAHEIRPRPSNARNRGLQRWAVGRSDLTMITPSAHASAWRGCGASVESEARAIDRRSDTGSGRSELGPGPSSLLCQPVLQPLPHRRPSTRC